MSDEKKKSYTPGAKRESIRQYITKQGVRIPIGNASLTLSANIPKQKAGVKLTVPFGKKKK